MKTKVIIIVATILLATTSFLSIYMYGENRNLKNEITKFHSEDEVKTEMSGFIREMSKGGVEGLKKYMTGEAKRGLLSKDTWRPENVKVKQTDIQELRAITENKEKTKVTSYATYRTTYDVGTNDIQSIYTQTLSIKAEWIKVGDMWKCERYEIAM